MADHSMTATTPMLKAHATPMRKQELGSLEDDPAFDDELVELLLLLALLAAVALAPPLVAAALLPPVIAASPRHLGRAMTTFATKPTHVDAATAELDAIELE